MGFGVRFAKAMPYFQKERAIPKTESMVVHRRQYMLQFFMFDCCVVGCNRISIRPLYIPVLPLKIESHVRGS